MKCISRINWKHWEKHLLLTLTYPDDHWDKCYELRTQQRDQFIRDFEDKAGRQTAMLWRVEWKPRKSGKRKGEIAPHQHLVVFGDPYIFYPWYSEKWGKILGYAKHVQVDVEPVETASDAAFYVAKYCSKQVVFGLDNGTYLNIKFGRPWGIHRRRLVPWATQREATDVPSNVVDVAQQIATHKLEKPHLGGFVLFDPEAERLYQRLVELFDKGA